MRAPGFWQRPGRGWQAHVLAPLAWLYAAATARRVSRPARYRPPCPVICVGNISAGGTGKTPVVIALVQRLAAEGLAVHVVSRGHGGRLAGPVEVDPGRHNAGDVGDEPLLIAAFTRVFVGRDRAEAGRMAAEAGAAVIIMDDGHQNPDLARDLSLVVVDAQIGFGNRCVIPAGPLREPVPAGLARADALVAIGDDDARARFRAGVGQQHPDILGARTEVLPMGMDWQGLRVLAFAGIGRPEKFFATLRGLGAELVQAVALDDHQELGNALIARLAADADRAGAQLVTTEKDAVRLPDRFRGQVLTLPVRLEFDDPDALDRLLERVVKRGQGVGRP